ncbi:MAG TPA: outer membrane beta-barrel protein [Beijerinckiaceae bacterium]|jgi:opacity protein-like surface antigen
MIRFHRFWFAGAMTALLGASAGAADLDIGMAPPPLRTLDEARVEMGTGWYLRGDIAWAREKTPELFSNMTFSAKARNENGWAAGVGAGYKFNNWFRTDITYDIRNTLKANTRADVPFCPVAVNVRNDANGDPMGWYVVEGVCEEVQRASVKRHSMLLNGYVDLGSWSGVTPYVGAGLGLTAGKAKGDYNWYNSDGSVYAPNIPIPPGNPQPWVTPGGQPMPDPGIVFGSQLKQRAFDRNIYNFTWALMAGVAVDVGSNAKVDLGYRYVNMGKFGEKGAGDSSTVHEARIGLRYMID